jgi:solute carrier family 12 (potassium/chloride transporters), member 8
MGIAHGGRSKVPLASRSLIDCNPLQAGIKVLIMLLVSWVLALICFSLVFVVWFYVGTANPAVKPGIADEFRFFVWLKSVVFQCFG